MKAAWAPAKRDGLPDFSFRTQLQMLLGERRRVVAALVGVSVVSGFIEAATLAVIAQVAATLVTGAKHVTTRMGFFHLHTSVGKLILVGLALTLLRLALQWPLSTLPVRIAAGVQASLRRRLFRAYTQAAPAIQASEREGQLQEVMTGQTVQAGGGALQATGLITSSITFVIMLGSAVVLSAVAAAVVLGLALAMFVALGPLRKLGQRRSRALSAAMVQYAGGIAEANRLSEEMQVFGVMEPEYKRVAALVEHCRRLVYRTQLVAKLVPNLYQSLIYLLVIIGLGVLHASGGGHSASIAAVVLLLLRAAQGGQNVQANYQALSQSLPFVERLYESERRYSASSLRDRGRALRRIGELAFDEVTYAYVPGRPVLKDVSFRVDAGEAIGIVGPSGAGKSTLVQILLRLREPDGGVYVVNGEDVREFARADWQKLVAYVPQEPRLLHATVAENIRFFRDIDDEAVERAARLARIHDDVISWPKGYDSLVGPRADAVSGGQQQRICLARALAARPEVLVLDEPTSALDPHSETLIQESLTALKSELTLFTIAHRMSTLDMCDRVMVILDGRLAAFDTRSALQQHNEYYRHAALIAASAANGMLPDEVTPAAQNGQANGGARAPSDAPGGAELARLAPRTAPGHG